MVAPLGGLAWVVFALALALGWAPLAGWGIAIFGAEYAVFLRLGPGTIDGAAPLVAAGVFLAAELAFWSLERQAAPSERDLLFRRLASLALGTAGVTSLAAILVVAAGSARAGLGLEALGVAAAVASLSALALVVARSTDQAQVER